jgi:hypothetical protein
MAQDAEVKMKDRKNDMLDKQLQAFQDAYYKTRGGGNNALTW